MLQKLPVKPPLGNEDALVSLYQAAPSKSDRRAIMPHLWQRMNHVAEPTGRSVVRRQCKMPVGSFLCSGVSHWQCYALWHVFMFSRPGEAAGLLDASSVVAAGRFVKHCVGNGRAPVRWFSAFAVVGLGLNGIKAEVNSFLAV